MGIATLIAVSTVLAGGGLLFVLAVSVAVENLRAACDERAPAGPVTRDRLNAAA